MTQFRTPFMDGDEMISNCPIAAGHSHVYEFIAHPAGTTFYHSHSGSQRVAGMTGPLVIEDDEEAYADVPDRHVFIQDWSNQNSDSNFEFWSQNTPSECITFGGDYFTGLLNPRRDINFVGAVVGDGMLFQSFIINGQGIYQHDQTQIPDLIGETSFQDMQCPGQYTSPPRCEYCLNQENWTGELCTTSSGDSHCGQPAVIEVDAGTETRLRFAHAGGLFASQVCIDGHGVDLITADGTAIEPYSTDCFIIFTAERYDAIIKVRQALVHCLRSARSSSCRIQSILTAMLSYFMICNSARLHSLRLLEITGFDLLPLSNKLQPPSTQRHRPTSRPTPMVSLTRDTQSYE